MSTNKKVVKITHSRKGVFTGRIIDQNDEWMEVVIDSGKARYMSEDDKVAGDRVTLRKSFCTVEDA